MQKTINIVNKKNSSNDRAYWLSKTPEERLAALETLRQQYVRLNGIQPRLQRVCRIIKQK